MLTPKQLDDIPHNMIHLYAQVEAVIIADMARRMSKMDFLPSAQWQYQKLIEMGITHDNIIKALSKALYISKKEVENLMKDVADLTLKSDIDIYEDVGLSPPPLNASPNMRRVLQSGIANTNGLFENITRTIANTATKQFEHALDKAWLEVSSGARDYNSAITDAIKDLSSKGLKAVEYPSGHVDYLDVAVRRAVLTGVNQTALKMQEELAKEMECDLVETTAHSGARPGHSIWQGKVFSLSGKHEKYKKLSASQDDGGAGYGTGEGLGGWNCRHSFFPFFEGMSPTYTQGELDEMNAKKIPYNGKMLTEYEASQRQRQIERNIRKYKREYLALDAAGKPTDGAAAKLAKWQSLQKDFIKQTGMKRQYNRERVIKPVDNPLESGIIKESNTKPITKITDSAIDRVPRVEVSGYSDEQNDYIQHQHKELLKFARDKNDSKEVAFVFDSNLGNRREYIGTDDRLDFGSVLYGKDLFVMHNHPRNSSFSMNDLHYILNNDQIKSLSIIKNNGSVEILMKTSEYDKVRMQVALRRAVKKNLKMGTMAEYDLAIKDFLLKNGGGIYYERN